MKRDNFEVVSRKLQKINKFNQILLCSLLNRLLRSDLEQDLTVYLFDSIFYLRSSGVYWTLPSRVEFHRQHEVLAVCGIVSFVMIFLDECFAKVFLNLNLFFITTTPVSLMCQRLVDFYEPMYHRLLINNNQSSTEKTLLLKKIVCIVIATVNTYIQTSRLYSSQSSQF